MKLMFMEGRLGDICGMILYDQIFKIFQKDFFKIKFNCSLLLSVKNYVEIFNLRGFGKKSIEIQL